MPNLRSIYKTDRYEDLPLERECNKCGETKPRDEMIIQFRKSEGKPFYYFRPRCKECNNAAEQGHRREYKTKYLRDWRRKNRELNESYWQNDETREAARLRAQNFTQEHKEALAIQRHLRTHGESVTIAEARELLAKYGRCYPTIHGLSFFGKRLCERIRSRLKNRKVDRRRRQSPFEIRLMVYEEGLEPKSGLMIPPDKQPIPYKKAAKNLKSYWDKRKKQEAKRSRKAAAGA